MASPQSKFHDFLNQVLPSPEPLDPAAALRDARLTPRLIEERRPIAESLEWKLSELYWRAKGVAGFLLNEVPYAINNSGLLSAKAAQVLYRSFTTSPPGKAPVVMEAGAGTGLFARLLLDEFRLMCREHGGDYYDRLTYVVSDVSPETVQRWVRDRIFAGHEDRVRLAVCDAADPLKLAPAEGGPIAIGNLRAVFANYLLDSLPFTVLRKGPDGPAELTVRTHLTAEAARIAQYTKLTVDQIRELAASPEPADRAKLIPLTSLFEFEAEFTPVTRDYPYATEALTFAHDKDRVTLNHQAFLFIEACLAALEPDGFILLNDYGSTQVDQIPGQAATQRFGSSAAIGINFPLLDFHFQSRGTRVSKPEADSTLPIHPRLLANKDLPETERLFLGVFGGEAHQAIEGAQERARAHVEAGRHEQARQVYVSALEYVPRDWRLLGEVAEFLIRNAADYETGLKMARAALEINPWYSVWLWNVMGDALFALDRFAESHECYLKAREIEPSDPRTQLNLGYTYTQSGDYGQALGAIAHGLACDRNGLFRERLLEKQNQVLSLIGASYNSEQEWLARRAQRLLRC